MSLFQPKQPAKQSIIYDNDIASKIQQRRYQILVHSLLYYELDTNLVSDAKWSEWAEELVSLQKKYPEIAEKVIFSDAFRDFDGSTGFDLPYRDEQIVNIAYRLLRAHPDKNSVSALNAIHRVQTTQAEYKGFYDTYPEHRDNKTLPTQRKAVKKVEPAKRKKLF